MSEQKDKRDEIIDENKKLIRELDNRISTLEKSNKLLQLELERERGKYQATKDAYEYLVRGTTK